MLVGGVSCAWRVDAVGSNGAVVEGPMWSFQVFSNITLTYAPTDDSYTHRYSADENFGEEDKIQVGWIADNHTRRTLHPFLQPLPPSFPSRSGRLPVAPATIVRGTCASWSGPMAILASAFSTRPQAQQPAGAVTMPR